jgi:hypothetical protein
MVEAIVQCPHCQSEAVVKQGRASNGKARFLCQASEGCDAMAHGVPHLIPSPRPTLLSRPGLLPLDEPHRRAAGRANGAVRGHHAVSIAPVA